MRVEGNTIIGAATVKVAELVYLELNLKGAKIDVFKGDWLCRDRDSVFSFVEIYAAKFLLQLL